MAIEDSLEKIGDQLERIADAMAEGIIAGQMGTGPITATPAEKPGKARPEKPKSPTSKTMTVGKITQEQLHEKLTEIVTKLGTGPGRDAIMGILAEYGDGAKGMKGLDEAHYKAVHNAAQDLLDG